MNCSQQAQWNQRNMDDGWHTARAFNGSNMSLNLPPNGYYPQPFDMAMGPPPTWMNGYRGPEMFTHPNGMVPMYPNQGMTHFPNSAAESNCSSIHIIIVSLLLNSIRQETPKHAKSFAGTIESHISSTEHQIPKKYYVQSGAPKQLPRA